ncbi:MAG: HAD family hydrolase [Candidatus Zixiibacteriota bacterium]|nr:MAG: HAD family hydrolase [candidate division Zixibacteria bacterium]
MTGSGKLNIDGLLFDLGSTLLEYETIPWDELSLQCVEAGYEFLRESGHSVPPLDEFTGFYLALRTEYRRTAAESLEEWNVTDLAARLLRACGLNEGKKLAETYFEAYALRLSQQVVMFEDTPRVLQKLKAAKKKIGLVSNTIFPEQFHRNDLETFGILRHFDFTIFSSSFGYRKPHPLIYQHAIELMGIDPQRLLFIGDRFQEDYVGPTENGLHAMIKYRKDREYPNPMPEEVVVLRSLSELLNYLPEEFDDMR